jgi:hypothetical protein
MPFCPSCGCYSISGCPICEEKYECNADNPMLENKKEREMDNQYNTTWEITPSWDRRDEFNKHVAIHIAAMNKFRQTFWKDVPAHKPDGPQGGVSEGAFTDAGGIDEGSYFNGV